MEHADSDVSVLDSIDYSTAMRQKRYHCIIHRQLHTVYSNRKYSKCNETFYMNWVVIVSLKLACLLSKSVILYSCSRCLAVSSVTCFIIVGPMPRFCDSCRLDLPNNAENIVPSQASSGLWFYLRTGTVSLNILGLRITSNDCFSVSSSLNVK